MKSLFFLLLSLSLSVQAQVSDLFRNPEQSLISYSGAAFKAGRWTPRTRTFGGQTVHCLSLQGGAWGDDLLTREDYENFELSFEVQMAEYGNTGLFWGIEAGFDPNVKPVYYQGPEFQIVEATHPDAKVANKSSGAVYDLAAPTQTTNLEKGRFYKIRLLKTDAGVEHWIDGQKVFAYRPEDLLRADAPVYQKSKFKRLSQFGKNTRGKISIQDHGVAMNLCDLKIKAL